MNYEKEVKELLGEDANNKFLDAVRKGQVTLQQMRDIAVELGDEVGGNFKRAQESRNFEHNNAAARKVLSDWYQLGACDMDKEAAREKFISTLQHENIGLYPLAIKRENLIQKQTIEKHKQESGNALVVVLVLLLAALLHQTNELGAKKEEIQKLKDSLKEQAREVEAKKEEMEKLKYTLKEQTKEVANQNEMMTSLKTKVALALALMVALALHDSPNNTTSGKFYKRSSTAALTQF